MSRCPSRSPSALRSAVLRRMYGYAPSLNRSYGSPLGPKHLVEAVDHSVNNRINRPSPLPGYPSDVSGFVWQWKRDARQIKRIHAGASPEEIAFRIRKQGKDLLLRCGLTQADIPSYNQVLASVLAVWPARYSLQACARGCVNSHKVTAARADKCAVKAFILKLTPGLSGRAVARVMGKPKSTVHDWLKRPVLSQVLAALEAMGSPLALAAVRGWLASRCSLAVPSPSAVEAKVEALRSYRRVLWSIGDTFRPMPNTGFQLWDRSLLASPRGSPP